MINHHYINGGCKMGMGGMGKWIAALVLAMLSQPVVAGEFKDVPAPVVEKLRDFLDSTLLDSESARFRDIKYVEEKPGEFGGTVCGKVNSKNALGAYVGYRTFLGYVLGSKSEPMAMVLSIDEPDSSTASAMCASKYGYQ